MHTEQSNLVPLRRNRDFVLLWCGQTISVLGSRASAVAFPLLVLGITHSPAAAGFAGAAATLPYLLFFLPAGGLVDRWDRKRLMVACELTRTLALASIPVAVVWDRLTFGQVLIAGFIEGTGFVVFSVAEKAVLPTIVAVPQIPRALAGNEARDRAGTWMGTALGGLLYSLAPALPFVTAAVTYGLSLVTVAGIRTDLRPEPDPAPRTFGHGIAEGVRFLWQQPFIRLSIFLVAVVNIVFQALTLALIVLLRGHGASGWVVGLVMGCFGAGGLIAAVAAPAVQRRVSPRTVIIAATWSWTVVLGLLAVLGQPVLVAALVLMMSFIGTLWNVIVVSYQYTLIPARLLGRVKSAILLVAWGTIPLGSLLAGQLLAHVSPAATLLTLSALMLLTAIVGAIARGARPQSWKT